MSCFHIPAGSGGLATGLLLGVAIGAFNYLRLEKGPFNLDPLGERGAFEPFLAKYLRAAEFIITIATGSIVLLVGSSTLHGQGGKLPWTYASPLMLLACCVLYGVIFIVWQILNYEEYRHGNPHTRFGYALSLTLGFGALACFGIGYIWLIFSVTS
jgi:hypothetical protein